MASKEKLTLNSFRLDTANSDQSKTIMSDNQRAIEHLYDAMTSVLEALEIMEKKDSTLFGSGRFQLIIGKFRDLGSEKSVEVSSERADDGVRGIDDPCD